jgi:hypothetical protein
MVLIAPLGRDCELHVEMRDDKDEGEDEDEDEKSCVAA